MANQTKQNRKQRQSPRPLLVCYNYFKIGAGDVRLWISGAAAQQLPNRGPASSAAESRMTTSRRRFGGQPHFRPNKMLVKQNDETSPLDASGDEGDVLKLVNGAETCGERLTGEVSVSDGKLQPLRRLVTGLVWHLQPAALRQGVSKKYPPWLPRYVVAPEPVMVIARFIVAAQTLEAQGARTAWCRVPLREIVITREMRTIQPLRPLRARGLRYKSNVPRNLHAVCRVHDHSLPFPIQRRSVACFHRPRSTQRCRRGRGHPASAAAPLSSGT